jgi:hypothetical protein
VRRGSDPRSIAEMHTFSGRTIDVPSQYIAGKSDWGVYQTPGAVDKMRTSACTHNSGIPLARRRRALGAAGAGGTGEHVAGPTPARLRQALSNQKCERSFQPSSEFFIRASDLAEQAVHYRSEAPREFGSGKVAHERTFELSRYVLW